MSRKLAALICLSTLALAYAIPMYNIPSEPVDIRRSDNAQDDQGNALDQWFVPNIEIGGFSDGNGDSSALYDEEMQDAGAPDEEVDFFGQMDLNAEASGENYDAPGNDQEPQGAQVAGDEGFDMLQGDDAGHNTPRAQMLRPLDEPPQIRRVRMLGPDNGLQRQHAMRNLNDVFDEEALNADFVTPMKFNAGRNARVTPEGPSKKMLFDDEDDDDTHTTDNYYV